MSHAAAPNPPKIIKILKRNKNPRSDISCRFSSSGEVNKRPASYCIANRGAFVGPPDPSWYNHTMRKVLAVFALASLAWGADSRPKVRAITAFINIDPQTYASEIEKTMQFLNAAREAYRAAGFEVETVRIVTQPFT